MQKSFAMIGLALVLARCDVHAQDLEAAKACTRLDDNVARLACYDIALGAAKSQSVPQSGSTKPDAQAQFGDDGQLHRDTPSRIVPPKNLTGHVQQVASLANGLYRLTLDNGQIWQTTEADGGVGFKVNDKVTISRRVLSGYLISSAGNASVGAKRVK